MTSDFVLPLVGRCHYIQQYFGMYDLYRPDFVYGVYLALRQRLLLNYEWVW